MRLFWTLLAIPAGLLAQSAGVYTVDIPPARGETFASPCRFELTIPAAEYSTRAVWVIYDRGRETRAFYDDETLFQFAERRHLALLWARHCPSAETGELDPDPSHGLGRALLTALNYLEHPSKHGELSSSKMILLGSADAAALTARMAQFAPDRVLASIAYAPTGLDAIQLPPAVASIPQLIVANSADAASGARPFEYFQKHLTGGAPWVFAMHRSEEAGYSAAKPLFFSWIEGLLEAIPDTNAPVALGPLQRSGWWLFIRMDDSDAKIGKVGQSPPPGFQPAGWVPSKKMAEQWQNFVKRGR